MSRIRTGCRRSSQPRRKSASSALTLSDDWRLWVVDNALRGVARETLVHTLVANGVPMQIARPEVDGIITSPAFATCIRQNRRVQQLELVVRLRREMAQLAPRAAEIERRRSVSGDEFFERYLAASRPVVLTGIMDGWKARERWTPAYFKERLGDVEIEYMAGRDADPECDRNFDAHRKTIRVADYVDLVEAAGRTNDFYWVAHNNNMMHPELQVLLEDVDPPADIFDAEHIGGGGVSLWFGPAGTVTPLHHDSTNILFCQIFGRKRIHLISPLETALLDGARGFFAAVRANDLGTNSLPELAGIQVHEVVLSPGEALFIPAGFWHEVTALETSINFSLLNFRRKNNFGWYRPGSVR
jgi:hypothetical protein